MTAPCRPASQSAASVRVVLTVDVGDSWIVYRSTVGDGRDAEHVSSGGDDGGGYGGPAIVAALDCARDLQRALAALIELHGG